MGKDKKGHPLDSLLDQFCEMSRNQYDLASAQRHHPIEGFYDLEQSQKEYTKILQHILMTIWMEWADNMPPSARALKEVYRDMGYELFED